MAAANSIILVKIGGSTLGSGDTTVDDLVTLQRRGVKTVVVHGGGKRITQWMERQGTLPRFIRGLRVTDAASLQIVTAVLSGLVNKELVAAVFAKGGKAVGISGVDGGLLQCRIQDPELGYVGQTTHVDPAPILRLLEGGYIPFVAPVGVHGPDTAGPIGSLLNINADTAAGEIAVALKASHLIFLTDVEGVIDSSGRVINHIPARQGRAVMNSGTIKGGMLPKLEACLLAAERGIRAQIVDGRGPHALISCLEGKLRGTVVG